VGRVIAQDFEQAIRQTIWPKLVKYLPADSYTVRRDNRQIPKQVTLANGSIIYLLSDDQDDMVFEGTSGHWFWADEPIGQAKYIALRRGLVDHHGHCWLTLTPLSQPWIADAIETRGNDPDGKVKVYRFSVYKNVTMTRAAIDDFVADLPDHQKAARIGGQWLHLTGRVFKEWDAKPPFWVEPFDIPKTWPRACIIDPHPRKPIAVLWLATSPDNQVYAYRELFDKSLQTVDDVSIRIKELEGWVRDADDNLHYDPSMSEPIAMRLIDNSSREQERVSGDSIWKRFAANKLWCQLAYKRNAAAGYDAIHEALKTGKFEWDEPALVVFNACPTVKKNFLRHCWDEWATQRQRDAKGDKQDVRKIDDDFLDCIRYYYQTGLNYHFLKRESKRMQQEYEPSHGANMHSGGYVERSIEDEFGWQMS
jgi:hypothetical protein